MVTCDAKSNKGFDFDINIEVKNNVRKIYKAQEIKEIFVKAFNDAIREHTYSDFMNPFIKYYEDNTRVFTIKVKNFLNSRISYSCDFAIVYNYNNGEQEYIRYNKEQYDYSWAKQSKGFCKLPEKIDFCKKDPSLWNEVRKIYLDKKNNNTNENKKSRSLFAETINQVYNNNIAKHIKK